MALEKKTATDGLKKEHPAGAGADPMTTGQAYLIDDAYDHPPPSDSNYFLKNYAYGLDLGQLLSISRIILYDSLVTDGFHTVENDIDVWVSDDNITYTFYTTYSAPPRTARVTILDFPAPQIHRYFKVFCSSPSHGLWTLAGHGFVLVEMEAWGEELLAKLKGTVKEKGVSVQRSLRSYIRSTGALYDSTTSEADGSFSLNAPDNQVLMYVVALDDDAGDQYNALIFDRVTGYFE